MTAIERITLFAVAAVASLALFQPSTPTVASPSPVVAGSPPGEVAALQIKIATLEEQLAKLSSPITPKPLPANKLVAEELGIPIARPTSVPSAACECKVCDCDPCLCRPEKPEKLPVLSQPVVVPLAGRVVCSGGACRYVRRAILPWRR